MCACLETPEPTPPADPSTEARAARLKEFKREQLIVDYLNRGAPVAEIAARIDVGEKRMRAIIGEILARRMPLPPEEFAAIQVSRLNEAMLIAFSAMAPANLKAVDQVVKIVRALDRYHGFVPAARRRLAPDSFPARRPDALPKGAEADDRALAWLAELVLRPGESGQLAAGAVALPAETERLDARFRGHDDGRQGGERPEIPLQALENMDSAPGNSAPPPAGCDPALPAATERLDARLRGRDDGRRGGERPEIPLQALENTDSAPGNSGPAGRLRSRPCGCDGAAGSPPSRARRRAPGRRAPGNSAASP